MATDFSDPSRVASFMELDNAYVAEWGIVICGYINEDGEPRFETNIYGKERVATLIGALEIVKQDLVMMAIGDDEIDIEFEFDDEEED